MDELEPNTSCIYEPTKGRTVTKKKEMCCKTKRYKQHCFLAVSFQFTSYLMKNAIKNNVTKSTEIPLHYTHKNTAVDPHTNIQKDNIEPS